MNKLVLMLLAVACTIMVYGQQDEVSLRRKVRESSVGTWCMSNDTITFLLKLKKCPKIYGGNDTVDGVCGRYTVIKGGKIISEGSNLNGSNAYTDLSRFPSSPIGIYFYDELMKKSTNGSIEVVGDTLYWVIRPYIDTHPVTVYGKVISDPQYPKGWSVPIKAVLYRVKGEKE